MGTFPNHTISVSAAATLWGQYGEEVEVGDTYKSLQKKFKELPKWKARSLITARYHLNNAPGSMEEALKEVFGDYWQLALQSKKEEKNSKMNIQENGDETVVTHTADEVNHPIISLEDLLALSGTDIEKQEVVSHRINTWSTVTKNASGEPQVTRLWQVSATFRPRLIPLVPMDWTPPIHYKIPESQKAQGVHQAVIIPDIQIGFKWMGLNEGTPWAEPFHDRKAIDVALQILSQVQPEYVVLLGDNLDFQPLSLRWPYPPEASQTTAIAISEWRWLLQRVRTICPDSKILYMLGNHEARLAKYLDERVAELKGLTHFDGRKALSLNSLLGLDQMQIETVDYPMPYWLWNKVEIEHGRVVRQGGGSTAAAIMKEREHSVIYGHIHRQEIAHRTIDTPSGKRQLVAGSPGCLCRTDGVVPGADRPDWQQGVGVLSLVDGMDEHLDLIRIQNGKAFFGSNLLVGRDYVQEVVASTGASALLPKGVQ